MNIVSVIFNITSMCQNRCHSSETSYSTTLKQRSRLYFHLLVKNTLNSYLLVCLLIFLINRKRFIKWSKKERCNAQARWTKPTAVKCIAYFYSSFDWWSFDYKEKIKEKHKKTHAHNTYTKLITKQIKPPKTAQNIKTTSKISFNAFTEMSFPSTPSKKW